MERGGRRGGRRRVGPGHTGQGLGQHRRGAERLPVTARPLVERLAGQSVDVGRHGGRHLARAERQPVGLRRRREPGRPGDALALVGLGGFLGPGRCPRRFPGARPVAGQRGVQQPGQVTGIGELGALLISGPISGLISGPITGPVSGLMVGPFGALFARRGPGQDGVDAEPGDLHAATARPVQARRGQPQVGQPDGVRRRDGLGRLGQQ